MKSTELPGVGVSTGRVRPLVKPRGPSGPSHRTTAAARRHWRGTESGRGGRTSGQDPS